MNFGELPLFQELQSCSNILIAGAGGGFDVFSGLPLYLRLMERGHQVYLANYSFSRLDVTEEQPLVAVTSDSLGRGYFPEKYLCEWLDSSVENGSTVYTFGRTGVEPLRRAYEQLVDELELDAVVLVDGGTDSLMRGDEPGLGTPTEDMTSLAAVEALEVDTKLLVCIGFGVDTFHGVCHHYFLEAVADLSKNGHYLGAFSLLPEFEESQMLREAVEYVHMRMPERPSIVATSILAAIEGEFGDFHSTNRTRGSQLYINPLMSMYWSFRLEGVTERSLYLHRLRETRTIRDVMLTIEEFRHTEPRHEWRSIPL